MIKYKRQFEVYRIKYGFVHVLGTPKELMEFERSKFVFLFDFDGTLIISDDIFLYLKLYWKSTTLPIHDIFKKFIQV